MKNDVVGCLVFSAPRGTQYLCGFDAFSFGAVLLPYFSDKAFNAFPLTRQQADFVLSRVDFDVRKRLSFVMYPKADLAPDLFALENSPINSTEVS